MIFMTDKDKVIQYERFLHLLQMHAEVTMDSDAVIQLIANACRWSYAHRQGNGELSEDETNKLVEHAFNNLLKIKRFR